MKNRIKLHTKFIVLLISVSLIPLLIVASVTLVRFQKTLGEDATKLGHQLAQTATAEIGAFLVSQFGILENIAAIYQPDFPIDPKTAEGIMEVILLRSDSFADISVVDTAGKEIARKNRLLVITPEDLRDQSGTAAFDGVRSQGTYVGPVYLSAGKPLFDFGRRILDSQGQFAGAVFAQVDARIMPDVVAKISRIVEPPGRVYVVDDKGTVVAYPDLSYVLAKKSLADLPIMQSITAEHEELESSVYKNEKGDRVLAAVHPMNIELFESGAGSVPAVNWFVVTEQPEDAVFGKAREAALFSIVVSILAVLLSIAAAVFFAGKISHPIETLHAAAQEFGKGNLSYRAAVETKDEIGDLAESFNTTAGALEKTIQSLKEEEEIVEAERDKLSLILAGITNAVIAVDHGRNVVLFNRAAEILTGLPLEQALGKPIGGILALSDGTKNIDVSEYCPPKGSAGEGPVFGRENLRMVNAKGEEHFVNMISGRLHGGESINLGCVLTLEDITREYVMERTKREFVSIAAHQLRTPLTGMSWTIEALLSGEKGALNSGQKELAEGGLDALRRMLDLVNDLLDVSRIEEGRFGIKLSRQPLSLILSRVFSTFERTAAKKGIEFRAVMPEDLPPLDFDTDKIELVLNNIIDNAIMYTSAGGRVTIGAERQGSEVVIHIADTGIGIPAAESERIFTKFFRSRRALSHYTDGSGLGLFVAKNIVDQHGGRITFTSKEDVGTTFSIALPIPDPASPPPAHMPENAPSASASA